MATKKNNTTKKTLTPSFSEAGTEKASWLSNPAVRSAAAGLATILLTKLAQSMTERYPQISQLMHQGLESFEGKLSGQSATEVQ